MNSGQAKREMTPPKLQHIQDFYSILIDFISSKMTKLNVLYIALCYDGEVKKSCEEKYGGEPVVQGGEGDNKF